MSQTLVVEPQVRRLDYARMYIPMHLCVGVWGMSERRQKHLLEGRQSSEADSEDLAICSHPTFSQNHSVQL